MVRLCIYQEISFQTAQGHGLYPLTNLPSKTESMLSSLFLTLSMTWWQLGSPRTSSQLSLFSFVMTLTKIHCVPETMICFIFWRLESKHCWSILGTVLDGPYISVERPASHHQLQDPTPQHWGQSTTDWRPEWVLLQVWKAKAWSDTPHPVWPSHNTVINTLPLPPPPSPYCFSPCTQDMWRWCKQSLQETEDKKCQMPRQCLSSLPQSLCCSAIIHLHNDLQQITGTVWSPLLLQTLHHHPCTQETKNHRT